MAHFGEIMALLTALCWTVTAMSFESAGKRVGSLAVNMIRLLLGMLFLSLFTLTVRGMLLPLDATPHAWIWLGLSGLIGFAVGDLCLFQAFVLIGSRISMLIMSLVPPMTAVIGWLMLGETLTRLHLLGMTLTVTGIVMVVMRNNQNGKHGKKSLSATGILFAVGGALGQAVGLVLSKFGMGDYNAFAATQIRIIAGIIGFAVLFTFMGRWGKTLRALSDRKAMGRITLGSVFGPFLGVSFSLLAVQYTATGVASTIMAIVPVLIIPPAVMIFRETVTIREIVGAVTAVAGVAMMFL